MIIIKAKMNMTKTKSPSKAAMELLLAIGTTKSAVSGSVRYIIGDAVNSSLSHIAGTMSSLESNFRKSAIGWKIPAGPAVNGPYRLWILA